MNRVKPSFWKVFIVSNPGINLGIVLIICMVFVFGRKYYSTNIWSEFDIVFLFTILAFIILAIQTSNKYRLISDVFVNGLEISGKVADLYFWMGLGYVTVEYMQGEQSYRSTDRIKRISGARDLRVGQKVMLFINHKNPKQAFIRDLYLNTF